MPAHAAIADHNVGLGVDVQVRSGERTRAWFWGVLSIEHAVVVWTSVEIVKLVAGIFRPLFKTDAAGDRDAVIRALVATEVGDRRLPGWWQPTAAELLAHNDIPSVDAVSAAYDRPAKHSVWSCISRRSGSGGPADA